MTDTLRQLSDEGVAIWLDDLSRGRITTGNLADLIRDRFVVGVTTNPTIFQKAISDSELYDRQLRDLAIRGVDVEEGLRMITTLDVRSGCDVLRAAYDASGGVDGRVSIERYRAVMDAFIEGIERARAAGHDLTNLASVASFFVSRVDTEVDKRLEKLGTPEAVELRGKAAIANARLAFQAYEEVFATERWTALADAGAKPQRPLWASTGVKDPAYDDTMYVVDLVTRGVVNTMPEATLDAVADHGVIRGDTIRGEYASAAATMTALAEAGIDMADVVDVLEVEAVEKFETSWNELLKSTQGELERLAKADSQ
jgi:transaldolase